MKMPDVMRATLRFVCLAGVGLVVGLAVLTARGSGQQPAPTSPTVPTPAPKVRGHATGYPAPNSAPTATPKPGGPTAVTTVTTRQDDPKAEFADEVKPDEGPGPELTLGECIAIALERNPAIHAVRKRMEATELSLRGLNGIGRIGQALSPDLPVRKEQATRGITASAAELQKVHNEIVQDVTRLYYTVVYARQQYWFANEVAVTLQQFYQVADRKVNLPAPMNEGLTTTKLRAMKLGILDAQIIRKQTETGKLQAYAALREAMAVCEADFPFRVMRGKLPTLEQKVPLTKEAMVAMALERRPELALAAAGVDAFRLEVYAQGRLHFRRSVPTLAAGADIHAQEVPQALRTLKEYRPGAIPPEMPTQLVGTKYDRVCRAMTFSQKMEDVFEKTRNLVVLEAETSFCDLELATERLSLSTGKDAEGREMISYVRTNYDTSREKDVMFQTFVAGAKVRSDYVEAIYQHLLVLAAIERITAGGVCPKFPGREQVSQ